MNFSIVGKRIYGRRVCDKSCFKIFKANVKVWHDVIKYLK